MAAFVWGRSTAPAKVVEVERKESAKAKATEKVDAVSAASTTSTVAAVDTGKSVTTRRIKRTLPPAPPGAPPQPCNEEIEETVVDNRNLAATSSASSAASSAVKKEASLATERETFEKARLVEKDSDRWILGAMGRLGLDGQVGYGPVVGMIVGPVQFQAAVDVKGEAVQLQAVFTW